jgi:hypothetical protein
MHYCSNITAPKSSQYAKAKGRRYFGTHSQKRRSCSAISISEDSELRRSIKKFAIKESKLLDSIGMAHVEQEIQKRVLRLVKEQEELF